MELNSVIKKIHRFIEANNGGDRIVHKDIAQKFGISKRTYSEYYRGQNQPIGMKALLRMLHSLEDEQILHVVKMWKEEDDSENTSKE
jgi:transcriptional regulator with XRE-family HTH domain